MNPKVSVLLNVYNGQNYIGECIKSVLNQTLENFEFIIVDDGSTDETSRVVAGFRDARIRIIQKENSGIADSANLGIASARAPFIARIDHDDLMLPQRLEKQLAALSNRQETALACTEAQLLINDKDSDQFYRVPSSPSALKLRLLFDNPVVQSTVMMRTSTVRALGGYVKRPLPFPEDFHLWVRIAHAHPILPMQETLTKYRIRPGSASYGNETPRFNVEVSANSLHLYLAHEYSWSECQSLAALYHRMRGEFLPMGGAKCLSMLEKAALQIGGPQEQWDNEFCAIYNMQRRIIRIHGMLRKRYLTRLRDLFPFTKLRD